ncbi:MAG: hypothetical protein WBB98_15330 [Xanthobacteraceae bacterium]
MPKLIAIKPLRYATRMLKPGDMFVARPNDARILTHIKKARAVREPSKIAPPPASVAAQIQQSAPVPPSAANPLDHDGDGAAGGSLPAAERGEDIDKLRADAEALNIAVDRRWGAKRLQVEIDKALAG